MTPELKRLIDRRLNQDFQNLARLNVTRICVVLNSKKNKEVAEAEMAEKAGELELLRTKKNGKFAYKLYAVKQHILSQENGKARESLE